jgi:hypothetical protein
MTRAIGTNDSRLPDIGLAGIVSVVLAVLSVLVYFAVTRRNVVLLSFLGNSGSIFDSAFPLVHRYPYEPP